VDSGQEELDTSTATQTETVVPSNVVIDTTSVLVDPYGEAPLTAVVVVSNPYLIADQIESMQVHIDPTTGPCDAVTWNYEPQTDEYRAVFSTDDLTEGSEFGVPVLGLCLESLHTVSIEMQTSTTLFTAEVEIEIGYIDTLSDEIVNVTIHDAEAMAEGWTWANDHVFDADGNLRWYGPYIFSILMNGNLLPRDQLSEYNWLGRKVREFNLPGYLNPHHDSIELPNKNRVVCVSNPQTPIITAQGEQVSSVEDYVVELDFETSNIVNAWDFREFLDVDRNTVVAKDTDWLHMNTVIYIEEDDSILISGRYQGIVKITRGGQHGPDANTNKDLEWILAPHLDWGQSGWDGLGDYDPNEYLLTAVDSKGVPYPEDVQKNIAIPDENLDEFHWPLGHHGFYVRTLDNGMLRVLVFSNQGSFIFDGEGSINNGATDDVQGDLSNDRSKVPYSLAIEFEIDEEARTVRQVWAFGHNRPELYGSSRSGVNYFPETGTRMMITSGADQQDPDNNPKDLHVVEVDEDGNEVFHLSGSNIDVFGYRGGRVTLDRPWEQ